MITYQKSVKIIFRHSIDSIMGKTSLHTVLSLHTISWTTLNGTNPFVRKVEPRKLGHFTNHTLRIEKLVSQVHPVRLYERSQKHFIAEVA